MASGAPLALRAHHVRIIIFQERKPFSGKPLTAAEVESHFVLDYWHVLRAQHGPLAHYQPRSRLARPAALVEHCDPRVHGELGRRRLAARATHAAVTRLLQPVGQRRGTAS